MLTKLVPNSIFVVVIGISTYLYQRSFDILYGSLHSSLVQAQEQSQIQADFQLFTIDISYLTMSILWPLILCALFFIYKRYSLKSNEPFISKAVTHNIDLNIVFHIFVAGSLVLHLMMYINQISEALPKIQYPSNTEYSRQAAQESRQLVIYVAIFSVSYCLSIYLYVRTFFLKRIPLPG